MLYDFRPTAVLLTISLAFGSAAGAQSLQDADQPAEFPPSSFTGKQFADSRGCVFIRAGFDGAVTWVPRVDRKRNVLCNAKPTFASKPAPAPAPAAEPAPVRVAAPAPAPVVRPAPTARVPVATLPRAVKPAPVEPRRVAAPVYKPAPRIVAPAPRVVVQAPKPVVHAPKPVVKPVPRVAGASNCPVTRSGGYAVRCGPQADHPGNYAIGYDGPNGGAAAYGVANAAGVITVRPGPAVKPPPGYRAAFEDDRLNPNRGKQTHEGFVQMRLVWTAGTPRRLVDQQTGRDVTKLFPGLKFPFLSYQQQKSYVAVNKPVAKPNVSYVTKNVVPTSAVAASGRFVQVGTYRNAGNVRNAVGRLQALGLPARTGRYTKNGTVYQVVLAGPYADGAQLNAGLNTARRGGFPDAFARK